MDLQELVRLLRARIDRIEAAKADLLAIASSIEQGLFDLIVSNYAAIASRYSSFYSLLAEFTGKEYYPLVDQIIKVFFEIEELNRAFFEVQQVNVSNAIRSKVRERLLSVYGLTADGNAIRGGYIYNLSNSTEVANSLGQFLLREVIAKRSQTKAVSELSKLVKGGGQRGLYKTLLNRHVFDRFQEADRVTQTVYAEELSLQAALYVGGTIEGSREFCKARNGKIFTLEEIKRFGTATDTYGGYTDKSSGSFAGKPSGPYNPLLQLGGYGCRHTFGFVTNQTAVDKRNDLKEVNGKLIVG